MRGHRGWVRSQDIAAEAVLQADCVEVHQHADADLAHAKVGQDLRLMRCVQCGGGLYFDDDCVGDQQVRAEAERARFAFVGDRDRRFALMGNASLIQLGREEILGYRLQQAGAVARWTAIANQ